MPDTKYSVTLNTQDKTIISMASGFIQLAEAKDLVNQFKEAIKKVNTKDYALIVDGKDAKTVSADVVPVLQEALQLYTTTPFKKKYMIQLASAIQANQVKRVGEGSMDELEAVASIEEAVAAFKKL